MDIHHLNIEDMIIEDVIDTDTFPIMKIEETDLEDIVIDSNINNMNIDKTHSTLKFNELYVRQLYETDKEKEYCPGGDNIDNEQHFEFLNKPSSVKLKSKQKGNYKTQIYICEHCNKELSTKPGLIRHIKRHKIYKYTHPDGEFYNCNYCKKKFKLKYDLINHIRTHTGETPYDCLYCFKKFKRRSDIVKHTRIHTNERPYKCDICKKRFKLKTDIVKHMRIHTNERPFECGTCKSKFKIKSHLTEHIRLHTGEKPYRCDFCERTFVFKSAYYSHVRLHTGELPFECYYCDKRFNYSCNLKTHMKLHLTDKPFVCHYCNKGYVQKSLYIIHIRTHTNEKPYQCEYCSKFYKAESYLKNHIKSHLKESLQCQICSKEFKHIKSLKAHLSTHVDRNDYYYDIKLDSHYRTDRAEKRLRCNFCNKMFPNEKHLNTHKNVHFGYCKIDDNKKGVKKFAEGPDLFSHMKVHVQPFKETDSSSYRIINNDEYLNKNVNSLLSSNAAVNNEVIEPDTNGNPTTTGSNNYVLNENTSEDNTVKGVFRCQLCGEESSSYSDFMMHAEVHIFEAHHIKDISECAIKENIENYRHKLDIGTTRCQQCNVQLSELYGVHICDTSSDSISKRVRHHNIHFSKIPYYSQGNEYQTEKRYRDCPYCGENFINALDFAIHYLKIHSDSEYFKTDNSRLDKKNIQEVQVPKQVMNSSAGSQIDNAENKIKRNGTFRCKFCNREFRNHVNYEVHIKTHSNEPLTFMLSIEHKNDK